MPYDLTLRHGSYHELHGPWRVDAAAELIRAQAAADRPLRSGRGDRGLSCTTIKIASGAPVAA